MWVDVWPALGGGQRLPLLATRALGLLSPNTFMVNRYWASMVAAFGTPVVAVDVAPPELAWNEYHARLPTHHAVEAGGPERAAQVVSPGSVLLLCYPPPRSPVRALRVFRLRLPWLAHRLGTTLCKQRSNPRL